MTTDEVKKQLAEEMSLKLMASFDKNLLYFTFHAVAGLVNEKFSKKDFLEKHFITEWKRLVNEHVIQKDVERVNKILSDDKFMFNNLIQGSGWSTEDYHQMYLDALKQIEKNFWENNQKHNDPPDEINN